MNAQNNITSTELIKSKYSEYQKATSYTEINKYIENNCKYNKNYKDKEFICKTILWISSYSLIYSILGLSIFKEYEWYLFLLLILSGIVPIIHGSIFDFFWNILTNNRQKEEQEEKEYLRKKYLEIQEKKYELYINEYNKITEEKRNTKSIITHKKNICPKCGSILKVKYGKYGKFIGCSKYPKCRYTKNSK